MLRTVTTTSTLLTVGTAFYLLGFEPAYANSITYYDIDFSTPTHTVGSPPTQGSELDTISSIVFGEPLIESSFGTVASESLVFDTKDNQLPYFYDQIELDLRQGSDRYQLSFDLITNNFVNTGSSNGFVLLFDTPQIRRIDFNSDGTIGYYYPSQGSEIIGSFSDDTLISMAVDISLVAGTWDIFMNDELLYSGDFAPTGNDVNSIRFSFGNVNAAMVSSTFDNVRLDNIQVRGAF